ncbi:gluconate transporter inducer Gti1 [Schizosaccharomyces octosporus yFS286]|uniref:Gluconate transporter inducer Gti1 n=1 Tax=Schizosaccharomyces octosporus (strain yFS286) TaxID=483514 RepID=S9QYG0_SCHOY|nr:gluconate transporter inducer Gti1 [Schizosaccharomyces octosporus yFS286]EPX71340.1 gluconate transporter inducer Gti1 [Schizosaccharomyces octosporus yFS286]
MSVLQSPSIPSDHPSILQPSFFGYVGTTLDALWLFQACQQNVLPFTPRRPQREERKHIIHSGNVFIFNETQSGIKRWTDGVHWSPSRVIGNFLIYRQLGTSSSNSNEKVDTTKAATGKRTDESGGPNQTSPESNFPSAPPPPPPPHHLSHESHPSIPIDDVFSDSNISVNHPSQSSNPLSTAASNPSTLPAKSDFPPTYLQDPARFLSTSSASVHPIPTQSSDPLFSHHNNLAPTSTSTTGPTPIPSAGEDIKPYTGGASSVLASGQNYPDTLSRSFPSFPATSNPPAPLQPQYPMKRRLSVPSSTSTSLSNGFPVNSALSYLHDSERALVGSLNDAYSFKEGGLVKKTISLTINGQLHHLISYYTAEDVLSGKLKTPSSMPLFRQLPISPELLESKNFRIPPLVEAAESEKISYWNSVSSSCDTQQQQPTSLALTGASASVPDVDSSYHFQNLTLSTSPSSNLPPTFNGNRTSPSSLQQHPHPSSQLPLYGKSPNQMPNPDMPPIPTFSSHAPPHYSENPIPTMTAMPESSAYPNPVFIKNEYNEDTSGVHSELPSFHTREEPWIDKDALYNNSRQYLTAHSTFPQQSTPHNTALPGYASLQETSNPSLESFDRNMHRHSLSTSQPSSIVQYDTGLAYQYPINQNMNPTGGLHGMSEYYWNKDAHLQPPMMHPSQGNAMYMSAGQSWIPNSNMNMQSNSEYPFPVQQEINSSSTKRRSTVSRSPKMFLPIPNSRRGSVPLIQTKQLPMRSTGNRAFSPVNTIHRSAYRAHPYPILPNVSQVQYQPDETNKPMR